MGYGGTKRRGWGLQAGERLGVRLNVSLGCNLKMKFYVFFFTFDFLFPFPLRLCNALLADDLEEAGWLGRRELVGCPWWR